MTVLGVLSMQAILRRSGVGGKALSLRASSAAISPSLRAPSRDTWITLVRF